MSHSGTSRVVLVVEDELIVRSLVAQELRSAGWDVLETSTAEGAIEHLRLRHRVDVVFTDIQLAGPLSGWDVAEQFRADRVNLPVIYTSGNSFDRSRSRGQSLLRQTLQNSCYRRGLRKVGVKEHCATAAGEPRKQRNLERGRCHRRGCRTATAALDGHVSTLAEPMQPAEPAETIPILCFLARSAAIIRRILLT